MLKILVVDDHPVVRYGIKGILDKEQNICSVDEAEDGLQAVELAKQNNYDVILLDIQMPKLDGYGAMSRILQSKPQQKILMLSSVSSGPLPKLLLKNGAAGFLIKDSGLDEVIKAVNAVVNGRRFISSDIAAIFADELMDGTNHLSFESLSSREMQTVLALINGDSLKTIAERMNVASKTVSTYKRRIWSKLSIKSERELFDKAIECNVINFSTKV